MSRISTPKLCLHKASGRAVVRLGGKDHYLGRYGTVAAEEAYHRLMAEWKANHRAPSATSTENGQPNTVNKLVLAFWQHAEGYYRKQDGTPTSELDEYRQSLRSLRRMYGTLPSTEFSPLKLKAVRQAMIDTDLSRGVINKRVARIVRVWKWALGEELVSETVYRALAAVPGLAKGRCAAREGEPVKPVPEAFVDATLPFALAPVRAMIELQRLTGMRPGEVATIRGMDLDTTGSVWLYRPGSDRGSNGEHKTAHHGRCRVIAIGPRAQAILKPWLRLDLSEHLFQPREAMAAFRAEQRHSRKTKVQPSQQNRRKKNPRRKPGSSYNSQSYYHAILKAIAQASKARACKACKSLSPEERCEACQANAVPHWHPHQLRHTHGTEVRRRYGLEAAQVALGHANAKVTEVYAERDLALAVKVAAEMG